jgi:subtilisin family serine protease
MYIAGLTDAGQTLAGKPVVINMSLGGSVLDAVEKAAIDYAIGRGVIIVASAGNSGAAGMGYPGAYEPVISAGASGWARQWTCTANPNDALIGSWWNACNVADPTNPNDFYIASFSSREIEEEDQDLDVVAPGSWVVGPYQINQSGSLSYFYLSGTSMASPHVAGIVALMKEKAPGLTAAQAEARLQKAAIALPEGCRTVRHPSLGPIQQCWEDDATGHGLITADAALKGL